MKFNLIKAGVVAAAALLVTPIAAAAADMRPPIYKGVPRSVISYYNWSGLYIGGTVGYASGTSDWDLGGLTVASISPKGMVYGVTLGYNWQAGSFVYGLEGDYNFANVKGTDNACFLGFAVCEAENRWFATFRGRVGYAFDRFLPYLTAGGAYGNVELNVPAIPATFSDSNFGYTVGGGLEYAFLGNWTGKLEYLFVDLGTFTGTGGLGEASFHQHVLRVGLNYKFGGGAF
jgi:outer membrane immunogenic protein